MNKKENLMKFISITILFVLGTAGGLYAEEPLTIEESRIRAVKNSGDLQNASLSMETGELERAALKYDLFPVVTAGASIGGRYGVPVTGDSAFSLSYPSVDLSLSQRIYQGGTYKIEKELSTVETGMAGLEWQRLFLEIRNRHDRYFYTYLESLEKKEAAEKEMEAASSLLEISEAKFEAGMITKATYLKVKADAATKDLQLQEMEKNTLFAGVQLASYIGSDTVPELVRIDPSGYNVYIEALAGSNDSDVERISGLLVAEGMKNAPGLSLNNLTARRTELNAKLSKKQYAPSIRISVTDSLSTGNNFEIINSGSVSVTGSLTLSQWDRKKIFRKADISVEQSENDYRESVRLYILEVKNAWYELLSAARSVDSSRLALEYAEELYEETSERYRLSTVSYSDLADSEALVSSGRSAYIGSQFNFLVSLADLINTLGLEGENRLWELMGI